MKKSPTNFVKKLFNLSTLNRYLFHVEAYVKFLGEDEYKGICLNEGAFSSGVCFREQCSHC